MLRMGMNTMSQRNQGQIVCGLPRLGIPFCSEECHSGCKACQLPDTASRLWCKLGLGMILCNNLSCERDSLQLRSEMVVKEKIEMWFMNQFPPIPVMTVIKRHITNVSCSLCRIRGMGSPWSSLHYLASGMCQTSVNLTAPTVWSEEASVWDFQSIIA